MSHNPTPVNVINVSGQWSAGHYQRSSAYTYIFYWQGGTNNDSVPRSILYNNTTRKWEDNGSGVPDTFDGASATTTAANPTTVNGYGSTGTLHWSFTNPYYDANYIPGPTVTSHTEGIVITNDTITSSDFTWLKNGTAYSPTNMTLISSNTIGTNNDTGYIYDFNKNGTGLYTTTIDSKAVHTLYYDSSWTIGNVSGIASLRNTTSTRVLNILGKMPSYVNFNLSTNWNIGTRTFHNNNRYMKMNLSKLGSNASPTTDLNVYFIVSENASNIRGQFAGYSYPDLEYYVSPYFIIGAQQTMSHTFTIDGTDQQIDVPDWIYEAEPEGDGYVAPVTTASNGGGKPDRYPLIMTNLFNRNRSLYSIGMTHKDSWDLFL